MVEETSHRLKGWTAIAELLGQTPAIALRWHNEGMPAEKEGRFGYADPEELTRWVKYSKASANHFTLLPKPKT